MNWLGLFFVIPPVILIERPSFTSCVYLICLKWKQAWKINRINQNSFAEFIKSILSETLILWNPCYSFDVLLVLLLTSLLAPEESLPMNYVNEEKSINGKCKGRILVIAFSVWIQTCLEFSVTLIYALLKKLLFSCLELDFNWFAFDFL